MSKTPMDSMISAIIEVHNRVPPAMLQTSRGLTPKESTSMPPQNIPDITQETSDLLPRSRSQAKAQGLSHYAPSKPCPRGHMAVRFVSNYGCSACLREKSTHYRRDNIEVLRAKDRQYAKDHPEENRRRSSLWVSMNPDKSFVTSVNSDAKRRGATGVIMVEEWVALRSRYDDQCVRCGRDDVLIGVDHVIPIADGGENVIGNIQPMCRSCNSSKNKRSTDYRGLS